MAPTARQEADFRRMLGDLDRGGVTDLVYTSIIDHTTGRTRYINGNGNPITQEQVEAQETAQAALRALPPISAEEVLRVESGDDEPVDPAADDKHGMHNLDGNNDDPDGKDDEMADPTDDENDEMFDLTGKPGNGDEVYPGGDNDDHGENQSDDGEQKPEDESDYEGGDGENDQKAGKAPVTPRRRTAQFHHRSKRWSETKAWQKIIIAEAKNECPENIDELVRDAEKAVGKTLKKSYVDRVSQLKAIGYDGKATQLADAQAEIEQLKHQLGKARDQVKKYKNENTKLKTKGATPDKGKGKMSDTPKPASTPSLNLPPPMQNRPTMTAPMTTMAFTTFPDTIIEAGVDMIRATGEKNWSERAKNWVALAESRPRLEYK